MKKTILLLVFSGLLYSCSFKIGTNCRVSLDGNTVRQTACISCDSLGQKFVNQYLKKYTNSFYHAY